MRFQTLWIAFHLSSEKACYLHVFLQYVDYCVSVMCVMTNLTRDALQLLVPSDEIEKSSDRFHLP